MDRENLREEVSLDLMEILYLVRKHILLIAIVGILGCVISYFYLDSKAAPQYQAWTTMIVNNSYEESSTGTLTTSQIESSKSLIDTYAIILKSDRVLNQVIENLELDVHYTTLANMIGIVSVNGTQIMELSVTNADPDFAFLFLSELAEVAPPIIIDVVEAGSVKTITEPQMPTTPLSTSIARTAIIYGMALAVAVAGFVVLKGIMDTRIKSEADLERLFDVPVLGVIPTIESCGKGGKGAYYGK